MFKRAKFGNKKVVFDGIKFDSMLECAVYKMIKADEQAGLYRLIDRQEKLYLTRARILYKPDFKCVYPDGQEFRIEAKGKDQKGDWIGTQAWRLKRRLYQHYGPSLLLIYSGTWKNPVLDERIIPEMT